MQKYKLKYNKFILKHPIYFSGIVSLNNLQLLDQSAMQLF
jgi:hypothetical protein